jgi:membrane associated rhomboid family serine protease
MHTPWKNLTDNTPKPANKLYWLIGINVIVFLVAIVIAPANGYLRLPAYLPALLAHFWAPVTYLFVHDGFISIIFNLLWLYWMGQLFEEYLGDDRLVGMYLLGGIAGAILFVALFNLVPGLSGSGGLISGASASIVAIVVATATLLPNNEIVLFIWPVKLKWLVVIYALFDLINFYGIGFGVVTAHIGAAAFAFLYIKQLKKGNDWIRGIASLFKRRGPLKVASKNPLKKPSDRPRQDEVDEVLDKISKKGYDSLSKQEKEILFRASKNEN